MFLGRVAAGSLALCLAGGSPSAAFAQAAPQGVIEGDVSAEHGTIKLPGALVEILLPSSAAIQQRTNPQGHFRLRDLPPGQYRLRASLDGFRSMDSTIVVAAGTTTSLSFDLSVSAAETVTVTGQANVALAADDVAAPPAVVGSRDIDQFSPGGGVQGAMRLLADVMEVPGGLSIKGGRPDQAGVQLGRDTVVEPSTGLAPLIMPADAVDSVAVMPNPYSVEFGRFSSGLVVISTRRGENVWRLRVNDFDPDLRTKRSENWNVIGVKAFEPRLELGGPIVKDRLFVEQAVQYSYKESDIASRPETDLSVNRWISTFTRADVNATSKHSFVLNGGVFSNGNVNATLGTFIPPAATVDLHRTMTHVAGVSRSVWTQWLQSETTVGLQSYNIRSDPHGGAPMVLSPETTLGNFFNRQTRDTASYQLAHTLTITGTGAGLAHVVKVGVDLLASEYSGSSTSGPVRIEQANGALARSLDFVGSTSERIHRVDAALFVEDQVQLSDRWLVEAGARLDRDGVLNRVNAAPRVGASVALNAARTAMLRGGVGRFTERTPLAAGVFEQFQSVIDTRYAPDGSTPVSAVRYQTVAAPNMRTAGSTVWSLNFEDRVNATLSWHAALLDRSGSHALIVDPIEAPGQGQWLLSSTGRSRYRDAEIGAHLTHAPGIDIEATYTRSSAREDLNAFAGLFGLIPAPVVGANGYGASNADAPNRLFVRARLLTSKWLLLGLADVHTGLPYSTVDAALDFVGQRNTERLPTSWRTVLGAERRVRIGPLTPWVGVMVDNPFNMFSPTDVQANLAAPDFGALYNSAYRKTRIIVRFEH